MSKTSIEHRSFIICKTVEDALTVNNISIGPLVADCERIISKLGWNDGVNKLTSFTVGKTTVSGRSGRQDKGTADLKQFSMPERTVADFVEFAIRVEKLAKKYVFAITLPELFSDFPAIYPHKVKDEEPETETDNQEAEAEATAKRMEEVEAKA